MCNTPHQYVLMLIIIILKHDSIVHMPNAQPFCSGYTVLRAINTKLINLSDIKQNKQSKNALKKVTEAGI